MAGSEEGGRGVERARVILVVTIRTVTFQIAVRCVMFHLAAPGDTARVRITERLLVLPPTTHARNILSISVSSSTLTIITTKPTPSPTHASPHCSHIISIPLTSCETTSPLTHTPHSSRPPVATCLAMLQSLATRQQATATEEQRLAAVLVGLNRTAAAIKALDTLSCEMHVSRSALPLATRHANPHIGLQLQVTNASPLLEAIDKGVKVSLLLRVTPCTLFKARSENIVSFTVPLDRSGGFVTFQRDGFQAIFPVPVTPRSMPMRVHASLLLTLPHTRSRHFEPAVYPIGTTQIELTHCLVPQAPPPIVCCGIGVSKQSRALVHIDTPAQVFGYVLSQGESTPRTLYLPWGEEILITPQSVPASHDYPTHTLLRISARSPVTLHTLLAAMQGAQRSETLTIPHASILRDKAFVSHLQRQQIALSEVAAQLYRHWQASDTLLHELKVSPGEVFVRLPQRSQQVWDILTQTHALTDRLSKLMCAMDASITAAKIRQK